jgi:hypothetical protein
MLVTFPLIPYFKIRLTIHKEKYNMTKPLDFFWRYAGVSKSSRTGRLELELQTVQLSSIVCSCIAILWISLVSFTVMTLCVASQRVFIVVSVYFVIDSVRKLLDTPSYIFSLIRKKTPEPFITVRVGTPLAVFIFLVPINFPYIVQLPATARKLLLPKTVQKNSMSRVSTISQLRKTKNFIKDISDGDVRTSLSTFDIEIPYVTFCTKTEPVFPHYA